ncbi:hypothetical protein LNKW23_08240 [Paralimibaculum aggregatum]|uniref:Type VI secretion system secreted protein Hcp n=1 Tax=Paralimibaculum aggregatum TaxID=3036245 RepID=A0ABQ6LGQ9_9RHOB|nr:type VI secretion system tube protein Hcp [Limibaculum sp. NKW23]GMG81611.1 hypothetical protein LNKW23_08240 [Limibaculum sp. NKW23]
MAEVEAQDAYIYFDPPDIQGESSDAKLSAKKAVEISEFSIEGTNSTNVGSAKQGANQGAGKVKFETVTFKKRSDYSTTAFWAEMAKGTQFDNAFVVLRRNQVPYLEFKFTTCLIAKVNTSQSGDEEAIDDIAMEYGSVKITYTGQTVKGRKGEVAEAMWSRTLNAFTDATR